MDIFDIPNILKEESKALIFISKRLNEESFDKVKSLTIGSSKIKFKEILKEYYEGKIKFNEACYKIETEVQTPPNFKQIRGWGERLLRSESSKIFTLGYGDFLLSQGETKCFIPSHELDHEELDCSRLIVGKEFLIKGIQNNIYSNYGTKYPAYPTVPLHANCRHVIAKINIK